MKILGGEFRNRNLKAPKGNVTRPTTSLVRKALFDICQNIIEGAEVLDLYSGSGALGIEALSRGAQHTTFIEKDRNALSALYENIKTLQIEDRYTVICGDVFLRLQRMKKTFNLITADPPYKQETHAQLLDILDTQQLLAPGGLLFIEAAYPSTLDPPLIHLKHIHSRKYGTTVLHQWTTQ